MATPQATVEAGTEKLPVVARLARGAERERIWAKEVALVPKFAEFEAASGREVPVVLLERAAAGQGISTSLPGACPAMPTS